MDIGKRLRQLREAKNLSLRDIQRRCGLLPTYISRVERGHTVPSLGILESWAKALEVELYQVFYIAPGQPADPETGTNVRFGPQAMKVAMLFDSMGRKDQRLLLFVARKLARNQTPTKPPGSV